MQRREVWLRRMAWLYAASLIFIAALRYIPGATDSTGLLLGRFRLDWMDDIVHIGTGTWAAVAAWHSARQSALYFRGIGLLYTFDSLIGLSLGQNPLHIGFWTGEPLIADLIRRASINLPHLLGGSFALVMGFLIGRSSRGRRKA